jgi:RNA polymerase sigma-70 factor (ECF subfamily)
LSDPPTPGVRIGGSDPASKQDARQDSDPNATAGSGQSSELTDLEAVTRASQGDHEAFRVLVERYQGRAQRLAFRVMRDEEQAKDVVQDAFLKAYRSLDRFEGRSSFYTWFYRVVMNLCLDQKRRQPPGRQVEWDEGHALETPVGMGLDAVDPAHPRATGPAGDLERLELREAVRSAIEELPDDARRTLLLREVDGLSYSEISKVLGVPKGTVMSRLHHARRRVRVLLADKGISEPGKGE